MSRFRVGGGTDEWYCWCSGRKLVVSGNPLGLTLELQGGPEGQAFSKMLHIYIFKAFLKTMTKHNFKYIN